jgi:hypothetical protein
MDAMLALAAVFLAAKITRNKTAGILIVGLLIIGVTLPGENIRVELVVAAVAAALWLTCLIRVGLLSTCVCRYIFHILSNGLVTFDLSRWYAWRGLTALVVVSAIALYGFKVALGGEPILGAALQD